jgi:hypothetical protein
MLFQWSLFGRQLSVGRKQERVSCSMTLTMTNLPSQGERGQQKSSQSKGELAVKRRARNRQESSQLAREARNWQESTRHGVGQVKHICSLPQFAMCDHGSQLCQLYVCDLRRGDQSNWYRQIDADDWDNWDSRDSHAWICISEP